MCWIDVNDELPDEGIDVITTDGVNCAIMYYLMSGSYTWIHIDILNDDISELPFNPIYWMKIPKLPTKSEIRENKINKIIGYE